MVILHLDLRIVETEVRCALRCTAGEGLYEPFLRNARELRVRFTTSADAAPVGEKITSARIKGASAGRWIELSAKRRVPPSTFLPLSLSLALPF